MSEPSVAEILELGRQYPLPPADRLSVLIKIIKSMQIRGSEDVKKQLEGDPETIARRVIEEKRK